MNDNYSRNSNLCSICNYIEYMLKRLLVLNRDIQIEREVLLGFSNVKIGEADMVSISLKNRSLL